MNRKYRLLTFFLFPVLCFLSCRDLYADDVENVSYMERGFTRILAAPFQVPKYLVQRTLNGPPLVGTVDGALTGTYYTAALLTGGVFDILRGTIPYAKYLIFFI